MKTQLLVLLMCATSISTFAQFGSQQIITTNADGARSVFATDLDGDGDLDILSVSVLDDTVAWYENTDGLGNFGPQQVITTNADGAVSVFATDLDNDGDMDVLSVSQFDDTIAYYKNLSGGTFSAPVEISTNADGATSVYAIDLDGDNTIEILSASKTDDKISWYKSVNGSYIEKIISTNADGATSVFAADIDGDGDSDVLSASFADDKIAWYENTDGLGTFTNPEQVITTNADGANDVYAVDIDGDGDIDVLSASQNDNTIAWYENTNGLGGFGAQQNISTSALAMFSVYTTDLDNDGDMDVLSASPGDNKIAWYENLNGLGNFGAPQIITTNAISAASVYAADLDNDGDMDVLSASVGDDTIAWYENLNSTLAIDENTLTDFSISPIPANNTISVNSTFDIQQIHIYSNLGQLVLSNTNRNNIDISNLSQGLYFIKFEDENGSIGTSKIIKSDD